MKNANENKTNYNVLIPEDMKEFYITGGAIASTRTDIRLILFNDELVKNNDILEGDRVNLIKTAKIEVIMSPVVAKQLRNLLDSELKKYNEE